MGLLFGNSSKESKTDSYQTDNRRVLGDGSASFELSGQAKINDGVMVDGYGNTLNSTSFSVMTDQGAMDTAARIAEMAGVVADRATSGAYTLSSDALGLAGDALYSNGRATRDALDYGHAVLDIAGASMDRATAGALGFGSGALADTLAANRTSLAQSFAFGNDAMDKAGAAVSDALRFGLDTVDGAISAVTDSQAGSFRLVDNVVDNVFARADSEASSLRSIYESALSAVGTANAKLGDAYADSQGRGALTDKIMMLAIGGALLVAALASFKK